MMTDSDVQPQHLDTDTASSDAPAAFHFDNSYARLPQRFYARVAPTRVAAPRLLKLNMDLARALGIDADALVRPEGVEVLAGNRIAPGSEPLAAAYAGHQFGHFVPQLGDGRAILLGEVIGRDGERYDVQLKGSGRTPFSRGGDGRAAVGPVLREYIVSEAMAALGVPTTRSLAAVATGETVLRETVLPGAVLTRVASSHLRVGTFEYFSVRQDTEALRTLAEYAMLRHYPACVDAQRPIRSLLDAIIARQAHLIAQWMLLGFIHGVMNTDNMSIAGETIDYGPCAFMEAYNPATVYSSIDRQGRYAYGNQPHIALWNLTRLAECLLPLLEQESGTEGAAMESAKEALSRFVPIFEAAQLAGMRRKLGLFEERERDLALAQELLQLMALQSADFTLTFRGLCRAAEGDPQVRTLFAEPGAFDAWAARWQQRMQQEPTQPQQRAAAMRQTNPAFIPRNHRVEAALNAAMHDQDLRPFEEILDVLSRPFDDRPEYERYTLPAQPEERVLQTFCGT